MPWSEYEKNLYLKRDNKDVLFIYEDSEIFLKIDNDIS